MIQDTNKLNYLFQNVHKNIKHLQSLLDLHANDTDICFFQEVPFYLIRRLPSFDDPNGTPFTNTAIHGAWVLVNQFERFGDLTQVATYVNKKVLSTHSIFVDPFTFNDCNILHTRLTNNETNDSMSMVNVYNNPSRANVQTMNRLLNNMKYVEDLAILQGDFNLHHEEWDDTDDNSPNAEALLQETFIMDLLLINNDKIPTWIHDTNRSSVTDLVFVSSAALTALESSLTIDAHGRGPGDHAIIRLTFTNRMGPQPIRYIKPGSDEEKSFFSSLSSLINTFFPVEGLDSAEKIETNVNSFMDSTERLWLEKSRTIKPNSRPVQWWNDDCTTAKDNL
ncbi:hypothetical protein M378DRAFT_83863, partial [Amanita muscaria Koide BX008]